MQSAHAQKRSRNPCRISTCDLLDLKPNRINTYGERDAVKPNFAAASVRADFVDARKLLMTSFNAAKLLMPMTFAAKI
jgi:hypothetical protein